MDIEPRALAAALIPLAGFSISQAAKDANVDKSNLSVALRGARSIATDAWARVLAVLGAPGGRLAAGVVHRWEVRDQGGLDALRTVMSSIGHNWNLVPLAFSGGIALPPVPLFALRHDKLRALVRYHPRLGVMAASAFPTPDRLPGTQYAAGLDQAHPRRVEDAVGRAWWDGGDISLPEFDALFFETGYSTEPTWEDVIRTAESVGLSPADVLLQICSTRCGK